ncbi:sensory rhodopsin transducer [Gloeocapsa sp. BRSZ]
MKIGQTTWAIPGGHIPLHSTGHEPEFTSRDEIYLLNTSDRDANVQLTIYYSDREPVEPYKLTVAARRVRCIRFNDLIDPEAIFLDTDYASVIESDVPIVVQFGRIDTSQSANAIFSTMAFSMNNA